MPNVSLERATEEIAVGEYIGPHEGHFAVKLPSIEAIEDFRFGMRKAGYHPRGVDMNLSSLGFDDHFLLLFPEDTLQKHQPMNVRYELSDEVKQSQFRVNVLPSTEPALLALGRALDRLYGEDCDKTYVVTLFRDSISAIASVSTEEFQFQVKATEFDQYHITLQAAKLVGWTDCSETASGTELAQKTETMVAHAIGEWLFGKTKPRPK